MFIMNGVMALGFILLFLNPTNNPVYLIGVSFIGSLGFGAPAICYGMVGDSLEHAARDHRDHLLHTAYFL